MRVCAPRVHAPEAGTCQRLPGSCPPQLSTLLQPLSVTDLSHLVQHTVCPSEMTVPRSGCGVVRSTYPQFLCKLLYYYHLLWCWCV